MPRRTPTFFNSNRSIGWLDFDFCFNSGNFLSETISDINGEVFTDHIREGDVEEDSGANGQNPLLSAGVGAQHNADVEPTEGRQSGREINYCRSLDRQTSGEKYCEIAWKASFSDD